MAMDYFRNVSRHYRLANSLNLKYATTADSIKTTINSESILYSFFVM
ncbi:hypothetical protein KRR40_00235 [Niabella defluvii]|nr:hypothetical protein KRR40_00235 [Niabella sp. I65]